MNLNKDTYSIRQVIELTGVSEFLLRIWELRYKAVAPKRNATGRRHYSAQDVVKIASLHTLCERGHRIGKIAHLSISELQNLIKDSFLEKNDASPKNTPPSDDPFKDKNIKKLFQLLSQGQWTRFKTHYYKVSEDLTSTDNIFKVILPLVKNMNTLVLDNKISIAQEHFVTALIKEQLQKIKAEHFSTTLKSKYKFIFATPEGDIHDLGLLIASALTSILQMEGLYLGPHLPKKDLTETCLQFKATHLILVSTVSEKEGAAENILSYLNFIERNGPKNLKIWLAGRNTQHIPERKSEKIQVFNSFEHFYAFLKKGDN